MNRRLLLSVAVAVSTIAPFASAIAQPSSRIPGLHLAFTTPTGTAYQTSPVDVFLTLTLDAGAPPFNFDGTFFDPSSPTPFGIPKSTLPTSGFGFGSGNPPADFAPNSYDSAFLFLVIGCGGTFLANCPDLGGPPYDFAFGPGLPTSDKFSFAPGTSMSFLLGTFMPTGGSAPPGTYTFFDAELIAQVNGQDKDGNEIFGFTDGLVDTCDGLLPSCGFTRSVVPAPEPATFGLFGLGLGFVGLVRRQRRKA